jgi:membrane protease YdiL (CAAX protease family)
VNYDPLEITEPELKESVELSEMNGNRISLPTRLIHFFEVLLVALGGHLFIAAVILVFRLDPIDVTRKSVSVFYLLMAEASITMIIILVILKRSGGSFSQLSRISRNWKRESLLGLALVPILFASTFSTRLFFQIFFPDFVTQENPLLDLIRTPFDVILFLISSLFVGGIKEEVQRAFVLIRFETSLGGAWLGLVVWSAFFGFGHLIQGIDNAFAAGFLGLLFGLIYIWRRNLWAVIIAHAVFDIFAVFAYWIWLA